MASATQLKRSSPEAEGIPTSAVLDFIRAVEQHTHPLDAVQGFMLLRHGHVAAEGRWTPYGRTATWFRGTQVRHEGHIRAGGVAKDVTFVEEADSDINDKIDAAYRTKYQRYPQYVTPMVTAEAQSTTIKPRLTIA